MPAPLKVIVQRMIDAGEPEANIATVIKGYKPVAAEAPSPASTGPFANADLNAAVVNQQRMDREKLEALPTVGGVVGGILGGPAGAALGGAGGEAFRQLGRRAYGESAPATPAAAARAVAVQGAGQGLSEGLGNVATAAATKGATAVYRGFLKPSLSERMLPKADEIVRTALDEALPITKAGVATGQRLIGELRTEVEDILARTKGAVDLHQIADRVRVFAKRKYYKPGVDVSDYKAAVDVADKLDAHPSLNLPAGSKPTRIDVSPTEANDIKRGLYTSIKETGFGVNTGAKKTTEKFAAHEVKTELEHVAKAIGPLNARESKLIDATRAIVRGVEREKNRNPFFGVPSMIAGAAGGSAGVMSGNPYLAATGALAMRAGMHPAVASRAAIVAYRASRELGLSLSAASRLAIYAVSAEGQEEGAAKNDQ